MKPAITILDYLWTGRKSWLKHHDECECTFESLAYWYLWEAVKMQDWAEIVVIDEMPSVQMIRMSAEDWDEICGPTAEMRQLQEVLDLHMTEVSKLMTLQATKERQSSE